MLVQDVPDGAVFKVTDDYRQRNNLRWAEGATFRRIVGCDYGGGAGSIYLGGGRVVTADVGGVFYWSPPSFEVEIIEPATAAVVDKRQPKPAPVVEYTSDLRRGEAAELTCGRVVLMTGEGPMMLTGDGQWDTLAGRATIARRLRVSITIEEG